MSGPEDVWVLLQEFSKFLGTRLLRLKSKGQLHLFLQRCARNCRHDVEEEKVRVSNHNMDTIMS